MATWRRAKMRIISFAYMTPALLAGRKTVTRRDWDADYAKIFKGGDTVSAFNRSPRFSGKKVAEIELLSTPVLESTYDMPDSDYEAEGFSFMYHILPDAMLPREFMGRPCTRNDFSRRGFDAWRARNELLFTVRFKLVRVISGVRTVY
jgi:uncharacterized protein YqfB (UPF0267 family)